MARKQELPLQTNQNPLQKASTSASRSEATERLDLRLSQAQRLTILRYTDLPDHLAERLAARGSKQTVTQFTADELDELLDHVETAPFRAKGNEKQKVLRIVEKISGVLGSNIDLASLGKKRSGKKSATAFQIRMTLKGIETTIWRRIQTTDCTLEELHALIQVTMGWEFEHLYRFIIGGVEFMDLEMADDEEAEDSFDTFLSEVIPAQNRRPRFDYEYDFGDGWMHQLIVEERFRPERGVKYPLCVAGERACPPEDCGGPWGYAETVEAIKNPNHPRRDELLEWLGDEFDPEKFNLEEVNRELRGMRFGKA